MTFKEKFKHATADIKKFLFRVFTVVAIFALGFLAGVIFIMEYYKGIVK